VAPPPHTLIQLSDLHVVEPGGLLYGVLDTAATLRVALAHLEASGLRPEALILSGDLTDTGSPAAYARLREIVEPVAARLGSPVLYAAGNHDDRSALRAAFFDAGRADARGLDPAAVPPAHGPIFYARWLGGLRVAVLDSSVPGHPHGELGPDQLDWLADLLREPAPDGTVVVLHHPPVPNPNEVMDLIPLRDDGRLAAVVRGSDAKIVLTGHWHSPSASLLAGVPLWIAGATAYALDPLSPPDLARGIGGGQYTRVDVYPDVALATAVSFPAGPVVHELTRDELERSLATLGDR
jgi:3',5'-cyclic AMP phosphodiesterase CpdA